MRLLMAVALTLPVSSLVRADTLELKDGNLLKGRYMGGSQTTVRFEVAGAVQVIPTSSVISLTFTGGGSGAASAAPAPKTAKPQTAPGKIPAGTVLHFKFSQGINSRAAAGLQFKGQLETALYVNGQMVAPAGAPVYGQMVESKKGGRLVRRAELSFTLTHIVINNKRYPITTETYKAKGERQGTLRKVGAGAAIGAIAGGGKGARIGSAVGAGVAVVSPGKQVNIPKGTILEFRLKNSLTVK
jgi:hypothetical protein